MNDLAVYLSDGDRTQIKSTRAKRMYCAILYYRGPRGRKYRSIRTALRVFPERVEEDVNEARLKQYAHGAFLRAYEVVEVDSLGRAERVGELEG